MSFPHRPKSRISTPASRKREITSNISRWRLDEPADALSLRWYTVAFHKPSPKQKRGPSGPRPEFCCCSSALSGVIAMSARQGAMSAPLAAPDVDSGEEEEPDNVNEVPVPGGGLEADVLLRCEVTGA